MKRSALSRNAARAERPPRTRRAQTLRRFLPRREALRRAPSRALSVALVGLLLFAQTPAVPRVLAD
ncbi:MAG TPA: hypothetical protein VN228_09355, partial [Pyrinomonadaceae bacterium]|nr:hypothetical protein [Pyrinomonadaceae bacterium]